MRLPRPPRPRSPSLQLATLLAAGAALAPAAHAERADSAPLSRGQFLAVAIPDGEEVVVLGGRGVPSGKTVRTIEMVDADGTWRKAGSLRTGRAYHTATVLDDGRILIAGGQTVDRSGYGTTASAELYDMARGKARAAASLLTARQGHQAVRLADGSVLVAGDMFDTATTERWSVESEQWEPAGDLPMPISRHALAALPDGGAVLAGGMGIEKRDDGGTRVRRSRTLDGVLTWSADDAAWTHTARLRQARAGATATVMPDGGVLIIGGADERQTLRTAELCDLTRGTCKAAGTMARARTGHQAIVLASGEIAVIGGETGAVAAPRPALDIEIYNPHTRRWRTATARINQANGVQVAALGGSGDDLLVLGLDPACKDTCAPTMSRLTLR